MFGFNERTGRVSRALFHRGLMAIWPGLRYLGGVPGYRHTANQLIRAGFCAACIPGGADEMITGHEHSYDLQWPSKRKGFAACALKTGCPIVPSFMRNGEEMKFNPVFWLANMMRLHKLFALGVKLPLVGRIIYTGGIYIAFCLAWLTAIPVPVQVTTVIGDPIIAKPGETLDELVARSKESLQSLIRQHHPTGHKSYSRALRERWSGSKRKAQ
mmetsp:Transcript_59530/g.129420  ORF Transcript_59530/g.129420 Transcript_59530/m.129420 type:complete len:214 (+) Transcript_59530:414-1055(+)